MAGIEDGPAVEVMVLIDAVFREWEARVPGSIETSPDCETFTSGRTRVSLI
jgi:hypothetical protein